MSARARTPLVTVCIPTYDGAKYLPRCLESVRAQTFRDFELLVVDDASADDTVALARAFAASEPRLKLRVNARNRGLVGNWNRCLSLARGRWIKFVFQDDFLEPRCLETLLSAAGRDGALAVCRRELLFEQGVPASVRAVYRRHLERHSLARRFPGRTRVTAAAFAAAVAHFPAYNCVGEPTAVLFRREAALQYGAFNADLANLCDWEFFARVAVNEGLAYVHEPLATFRIHAGSESARNRAGSRRFGAEVLDELIVRHQVAYAPEFAPVRRAALRETPRVDLVGSLVAAAQRARRAAAGRPDRSADWARFLGRYPALRRLLLGPQPAAGRPLAAARRLWKELADA
jgi:glycosyltransferase involved in cell wall biosynthesis